jgi:hypothetical protein
MPVSGVPALGRKGCLYDQLRSGPGGSRSAVWLAAEMDLSVSMGWLLARVRAGQTTDAERSAIRGARSFRSSCRTVGQRSVWRTGDAVVGRLDLARSYSDRHSSLGCPLVPSGRYLIVVPHLITCCVNNVWRYHKVRVAVVPGQGHGGCLAATAAPQA